MVRLTPIQASLKENEAFVYQKLLRKRKKPKSQVNDLVRVADLKRTFSRSDTINWSSKLFRITKCIIDTTPNYLINSLPERYNEALLKKSELTLRKIEDVRKKLNIFQIKSKCRWPSELMETNLFVNTRA